MAQRRERALFEWTGDVDREVRITMRGRDIWTRDMGNSEYRQHRSRVLSALPYDDGEVRVRLMDGRGDADVIQQPTSRNNYTTIVRIRDSRSGADRYRLDAYWDSYRGNNGNGGWGWGANDRGRRDDDGDRGYDPAPDRAGGVNGNGRDRGGDIDSRDRDGRGVDTRRVLRWTGDVDDQLEIRLQGTRVDYQTLSGAQPRSINVVNAAGLPQRDVTIRVGQSMGRGQVYVVQQPTARNGYTAVLRVVDPQGGYGHYDFDVSWE